jgi:hypothetical protein
MDFYNLGTHNIIFGNLTFDITLLLPEIVLPEEEKLIEEVLVEEIQL